MTSTADDSISEARVVRFKSSYAQDRAQASTLETIFELNGVFERRLAEVNRDRLVGIDTLLRREPFSNAANWADYRTWEFALAMERYLLTRFAASLSSVDPIITVSPTWRDVRGQLQRYRNEVGATLFVLAGAIPAHLREDVYKVDAGPWALPADLNERPFMLGELDDIPVLWAVREGAPLAYAIRVNDFARLTQFAPERAGEPTAIKVEEMEGERAWEIVNANIEKWNAQDTPRTALEWRTDILGKLALSVRESFELTVADRASVRSFQLAAPTDD